MKVIKKIFGIASIALVAILTVLYFVAKANPESALAIKLFYPENATNVDGTVFAAMWISFAATLLSGLLSFLLAGTRKGEIAMIILDAVGFLAGLMYSLLVPALLVISVLDIVALMFSVSYSQIDNDFNGRL